MASWQVLCSTKVDQAKVRALLAEHDTFSMRPNNVTRMMTSSNGLLVHRDPELCFVSEGPDDLDKRLKGNPLINDVLPSPVVRMC